MIEPAAYGAAVCFGPKTRNFRDVVTDFVAAQAAVVVADESELTLFVQRCLNDPSYAQELGVRAQQLVRRQIGAAEKTVELIGGLLSRNSSPPVHRVDASHRVNDQNRADRWVPRRSA